MEEIQYTIEPASLQDTEQIACFQTAMAWETEALALDTGAVRAGVRRVFEEPSRGFYLVARQAGGKVVGCLLLLREWSDWRNADVWWMHSVYVAPDHRRAGIFKRLFREAERLARDAGARGIRLYVDRANRRAMEVYRRLGLGNEHYDLFEKMF
jgi:GNAT superfamily N-acetyltransferase